MFVLKKGDQSDLDLVNWLTEKMIVVCCFVSRPLFSGIMKCYISETICKIAIF